MPLHKTQIARRQLGTALALFLEDCDPVSVHTLASAGDDTVNDHALYIGWDTPHPGL
jgi:hypothetical protein